MKNHHLANDVRVEAHDASTPWMTRERREGVRHEGRFSLIGQYTERSRCSVERLISSDLLIGCSVQKASSMHKQESD